MENATSDGLLQFPPDFRWGSAVAAHQVEGDLNNDWAQWEKQGKIRDGSDSSKSCQWWAGRYLEDLDLARSMGHNALRLSLEWSRLEPTEGTWDDAAVVRYRAMLTAMRERGIEPMVTLFHFTSPLWLMAQGGWESERTIAHFERFARQAVETFGDLVDLWCTINEINVYAAYSYLLGNWPPQKRSLGATFRVMRHQLCGHAAAYRAIHRQQPQARVGLAQHLRIFDPLNPSSPLDRWAARVQDVLFNGLVLGPPADGVLRPPLAVCQRIPELADSQDYIGLNYYSRDMVSFDLSKPGLLFGRRQAMPSAEFSMEGWGEIYPEGLYRLLKRLDGYGKPIYITETGIPDNTDSRRPRFLITHLAATHRALSEGLPVKGFYFWSLIDNFEWAEGFGARFGLIDLDLASGRRTLKPSGRLYADIVRQGGLTDEMLQQHAPELLSQRWPGANRH